MKVLIYKKNLKNTKNDILSKKNKKKNKTFFINFEVTGDGMHNGNPPYKSVHHTICIHTLYFSYPFFAWSAICISFVSVLCGHYHELLHLQA